ncbi:LysR family transcriptional regulator [Leeia aquatica]|uniref:LysR family transcriptional regulator n=1 Tax=Leeia aquatica TaxID=2725557 RepID=A0A847SGE7_9NEIS|nr:LysR family transcriptional regulator [Leeia aquatica]NLR76289.1 LysR family transcriptional regulator [Leeia aquatica]
MTSPTLPQPNPDWNDLFFFSQVVQHGGFAAASRVLGVPKSRLSRRIALLEQALGVRLLQRSTRRLALTDIGHQYLQHCLSMRLAADAAQETVQRVHTIPRGRVRFSCPIAIAQGLLLHTLPEFMLRYPEVSVEVEVTSRRVDLIEDGFDFALRVRQESDEDAGVVVRRLSRSQPVMVASPAWLAHAGWPQQPQDLLGKPTVSLRPHDGRFQLRFSHPDGQQVLVPHQPRLVCDDMQLLKSAILSGVGAGWLPAYLCGKELATGDLQLLLPDWQLPSGFFHLAYASRRGLTPAVRALIDFLVDTLEAVSL